MLHWVSDQRKFGCACAIRGLCLLPDLCGGGVGPASRCFVQADASQAEPQVPNSHLTAAQDDTPLNTEVLSGERIDSRTIYFNGQVITCTETRQRRSISWAI